jgi:radical SAM superfamily enzyme
MTRQASKGTCTFCHRELSKASMTRHLESCEQQIAIQGEIGSRQKAKKIKAFHLIVEGYHQGVTVKEHTAHLNCTMLPPLLAKETLPRCSCPM